MTTLILPPRFSEDSIILRKAALNMGWRVNRLPSWRIGVDWRRPEGELVFYGEPLFAAAVSDQLGLSLLEPPPTWLPSLAHKWTSRQVRLVSLSQLSSVVGGPWFIKPADDKCFAAGVYASAQVVEVADVLEPETPVLISDVFDWADEFRCFVANGQVKACSIYAIDGEVAQDVQGQWMTDEETLTQAAAFCQAVVDANVLSTPPSVVIDVGRRRDGQWAVVEANAAWGSGVYGCSAQGVLEVLRVSTIDGVIPESLSKWVRPWS